MPSVVALQCQDCSRPRWRTTRRRRPRPPDSLGNGPMASRPRRVKRTEPASSQVDLKPPIAACWQQARSRAEIGSGRARRPLGRASVAPTLKTLLLGENLLGSPGTRGLARLGSKRACRRSYSWGQRRRPRRGWGCPFESPLRPSSFSCRPFWAWPFQRPCRQNAPPPSPGDTLGWQGRGLGRKVATGRAGGRKAVRFGAVW